MPTVETISAPHTPAAEPVVADVVAEQPEELPVWPPLFHEPKHDTTTLVDGWMPPPAMEEDAVSMHEPAMPELETQALPDWTPPIAPEDDKIPTPPPVEEAPPTVQPSAIDEVTTKELSPLEQAILYVEQAQTQPIPDLHQPQYIGWPPTDESVLPAEPQPESNTVSDEPQPEILPEPAPQNENELNAELDIFNYPDVNTVDIVESVPEPVESVFAETFTPLSTPVPAPYFDFKADDNDLDSPMPYQLQPAPITTGTAFYMLLLAMLPIIGWIVLAVMSFSHNQTPGKTALARALVILVLILLVALTLAVLALVLFISGGEPGSITIRLPF